MIGCRNRESLGVSPLQYRIRGGYRRLRFLKWRGRECQWSMPKRADWCRNVEKGRQRWHAADSDLSNVHGGGE